MDVKRNVVVFVAACFVICLQPLYASADQCADVFEEAHQSFNAAITASEQKEFAKAIELYENAEVNYRKVSEMRNCSCPKIADTAKQNMNLCRNNAAKNRKALENRRNYSDEVKVFEIYNQGKMKFNEGNSYARNKEWGKAISAFEEAENIWESIVSTETENGRKARQAAQQARDLANLARQQLER